MDPASKNMQLTGAGDLNVTEDKLENNVEYDACGKTDASFHVINVEVIPVRPHNRVRNQAQEMTLLEKALTYREQNPEKWHQRKEENERRVNESYGIYERDRFLEEYYKRLAELKIEEIKLAERRKLEVNFLKFSIKISSNFSMFIIQMFQNYRMP